jgi:hypothetical protein
MRTVLVAGIGSTTALGHADVDIQVLAGRAGDERTKE